MVLGWHFYLYGFTNPKQFQLKAQIWTWKNSLFGSGKMTQLRMFSALWKTQIWLKSTIDYNTIARGSDTQFWILWAPANKYTNKHTCTHTHIHIHTQIKVK